jgi:hypothetical protein
MQDAKKEDFDVVEMLKNELAAKEVDNLLIDN